ncbi:hypothetical protein Tco_0271818 [Tanacetum coccineum]
MTLVVSDWYYKGNIRNARLMKAVMSITVDVVLFWGMEGSRGYKKMGGRWEATCLRIWFNVMDNVLIGKFAYWGDINMDRWRSFRVNPLERKMQDEDHCMEKEFGRNDVGEILGVHFLGDCSNVITDDK